MLLINFEPDGCCKTLMLYVSCLIWLYQSRALCPFGRQLTPSTCNMHSRQSSQASASMPLKTSCPRSSYLTIMRLLYNLVDHLPMPPQERLCNACSQAGRQGQRSGRPPGARLGLWRRAAARRLWQELAGVEPGTSLCSRRSHIACAEAPFELLAKTHPRRQPCRCANTMRFSDSVAVLSVLLCNVGPNCELLCQYRSHTKRRRHANADWGLESSKMFLKL